MARWIMILAATTALGGCARYTEKTSPCVCDWTPVRTAERVSV